MAENEQSQERTEEPTQRQLDKAREDGEVLSSKEMLVFASGASALLILGSLGFFSKGILDSWAILFNFGHPDELLSAKAVNAWRSFSIILMGAAIFRVPT